MNQKQKTIIGNQAEILIKKVNVLIQEEKSKIFPSDEQLAELFSIRQGLRDLISHVFSQKSM